MESVEAGTHKISLANQSGCTVGDVRVDGVLQSQSGQQTVSVSINRAKKELTVFIDVACV